MNLPDNIQTNPTVSQTAKFRALLLIGAPGSGKGTQGRALGALPNFYHCSCGDVFRAIDSGTELGRRFTEYSRAGRLMPDELTLKLWEAHLIEVGNRGKYNALKDYLVLDGIPRNVAQARMMDSFLDVRLVINLRCSSRRPLIDRIRHRALKEGRPDDANEAVINHRLNVYEAESQLLIKHYPSLAVHNIDAICPPHVVLSGILGGIVARESDSDLRHDQHSFPPEVEAIKL